MEYWKPYLGSEERARGMTIEGGRLLVHHDCYSPQLDNFRDILVYLPDSYDAGERHYPVVYMHDGQNLFDSATSFSGEWGVDDALAPLQEVGLETIVVGIPNISSQRFAEYSPFPDARLGGGEGEDYLAFITDTLKPLIDQQFRTLPGAESTGIIGSSLGGLISLYAFFHLPDVFSMVGVLSPALWFGRSAIFDFVAEAPRAPGRIYLDMGTAEGAGMLKNAQLMRDLLVRKGYRLDDDLLYVEEKDGPHNEVAWGRRLDTAMLFLFGLQRCQQKAEVARVGLDAAG